MVDLKKCRKDRESTDRGGRRVTGASNLSTPDPPLPSNRDPGLRSPKSIRGRINHLREKEGGIGL